MASTINADNGVVSGVSGINYTGDNSGVMALQTNGNTAVTIDSSRNVSLANNLTVTGNTSLANNLTVTGNLTTTGYINAPNTFGFRNRIINGNMVIDQRNSGGSISATGQYSLDRWGTEVSVNSKFTIQQNAGSVTPPAGFTNYLGCTSSAATSVGTTDYYLLTQPIEGYNMADLAWGTSSAKAVSVSFWVYSSLTGTFGATINNNAQNRTYPFSYTISSANTWTQVTTTIPGCTDGTWVTNNGIGARLRFNLGTGSTYSAAAGAWSTTSLIFAPTGSTQVVATSGATFYITGVQLEKGSTATSFDYRPYGTELQLCQRYYQRLGSLSGGYVGFGSGRGAGGTSVLVYIKYANTVRATPTISQSNTAVNVPSQYAVTSLGTIYYGTDSAGLELNVTTSVASGGAAVWLGNNNSSAYVDISAEL